MTNSTSGGGGGVSVSVSNVTATATNNITTPSPVQTGMTSSCDVFTVVQSDTTCDDIVSEYDISLADFYAWNPAVGDECTDLDTGFYVCVGILGAAPATTTASSISTPSPVQTGIATACDEFYPVVSGNTCEGIAEEFDVNLDLFYSWNPAIGDECQGLEYGFYVCVDVSGYTAVTTPTPIQTGMVDDCNKFDLVASNDFCYEIASDYDISLDDFYAWNPAVGTNCADLYPSYYVCVGVDFTTTATTVSTTTAVAAKRTVNARTPMITTPPTLPKLH